MLRQDLQGGTASSFSLLSHAEAARCVILTSLSADDIPLSSFAEKQRTHTSVAGCRVLPDQVRSEIPCNVTW